MSMEYPAVAKLQAEIDDVLNARNAGHIMRIRLGNGSEVADLSQCADVNVSTADRSRFRQFAFRNISFLNLVLSAEITHPYRPDAQGIYTNGGPLIIVQEITGRTIVSGVLLYLDMETGRGGI